MMKKLFIALKNKIDNSINKKSQLEILSERGLKYWKNFNMYNSTLIMDIVF